jgi:hypothetical protein
VVFPIIGIQRDPYYAFAYNELQVFVRFEVVTAVNVEFADFWGVQRRI